MIWFEPRTFGQRIFVFAMFLFVEGTMLFVWQRLQPHYYSGPLCARFGLLPTRTACDMLGSLLPA
ncbi:MAG: hypothetical protein NVS9B12_11150 [Vulcanimicrobiaceae bacterium]